MTTRAETIRRAFLVATCVAASGCAGGDGNEDTGTFSSPRPRSKIAKRYRRSTRVTARETRRFCVSITCPKGRRRSRSSSTTPTHPVGRTYTGSSGTCRLTQSRYTRASRWDRLWANSAALSREPANGDVGYSGPCSPEGDGPHTYRFTVYGVDTELDVEAGAKRGELDATLEGATVGTARLDGTYGR